MPKFTTQLVVKPSTIPNAGNGVFTKNFIKKGTPVCYYAGVDESKETILSDGFPVSYDSYALEHPKLEGVVRVGFRYPEGTHGVAQLVNDPCMFDLSKLTLNENGLFSIKTMKKLQDIYYTCVKAKMNIENGEDDVFVSYSTRDIQAGEELFFPYSHEYWVTHFVKTSKYPLQKVLAMMDYANEYIYNKDNGASYNLMILAGIKDGGKIHRLLGVLPHWEEHEKLSHIYKKVIQLSA
jgi:SET domain-containing protein